MRVSRLTLRLGVWIGMCALLPLPSQGLDAQLEGLNGNFKGDAIQLRWREERRTAYRPDAILLLENVSEQTISVVIKWEGPVCDGMDYGLSLKAIAFVHALYSQFGPTSTLKPGEWDAMVFPLALPTERERKADLTCLNRMKIRVIAEGGVKDRLELVLPAPLAAPGKRD